MEITEHQANLLRALADGKKLHFRKKVEASSDSLPFEFETILSLSAALSLIQSETCEVRIKPDVIVVNGIEVPAPVKTAPAIGEDYYLAASTNEDGVWQSRWRGDEDDDMYLRMQILHRTRDAAAVHGKAMRAHKPG